MTPPSPPPPDPRLLKFQTHLATSEALQAQADAGGSPTFRLSVGQRANTHANLAAIYLTWLIADKKTPAP